MKYEVFLTDRALQDLDAAFEWYKANAPEVAGRWYNGFLDALQSLEENPALHALARENHLFPVEVRNLLYGVGRRKTHRAIFVIRPDKVVVEAIRHFSQRDIIPEDLT
jgi:plasmid stabilization system protein ParE